MSLRALHIIFIFLSISLSFFFGFWSRGALGPVSGAFRGMGLFSFVLGGFLCAYLFFFVSKIRTQKKP